MKDSKLLRHALDCKKRIENWPLGKQKIANQISAGLNANRTTEK